MKFATHLDADGTAGRAPSGVWGLKYECGILLKKVGESRPMRGAGVEIIGSRSSAKRRRCRAPCEACGLKYASLLHVPDIAVVVLRAGNMG